MLVKWYIVNAVMLLLITKGSARTSKVLDPAKERIIEEKLAKELEEAVKELEIAEKLEQENNSTRDSRGLLKKLSFLAGVKVGGILQSSGTLAASNSIRVFGKVLNTAVSVSYGSTDELEDLPLIPRPIIAGDELVRPLNNEEDLPRPTDVDSTAVSGAETNENKIRQALQNLPTPQATLQTIRQNFLKNHNDYVTRVNNKFLREGTMMTRNL
ncbi:uncharacterized protein isoform X1 [Rhodnius prolixus]|uniref:uncharacterized protein isoform X1 n=1 Tax=Rhodnius prolixus TaxID=13249 RepID=UPI003D18DBC5